ncbi:DedA family protein [Candidatus Micrarchaeota archaeon]|nr:DedA family protein [Candidatus Micrarchaeota archaeon]
MPFLEQIEEFFLSNAVAWIHSFGGLGILFGMFLESSIVPIPSEAVLVTAGAVGFRPWEVAFWGTIGSTLGAIVGYYIGKKGGRPVVDKVGPYLFITNEKVLKAEKYFKKYDGAAVLVSRLIPFIPFKVFSITAGILKFDLKTFITFTFIGTIPRAFVLAWIGTEIVKYRETALIIIGALVLVAITAYYLNKRYKWF